MYAHFACSLLVLSSFLLFSSSQAEAQQSSQRCQTALRSAQNQIKQIPNLEVNVSRRTVSEAYPDHPKGRSQGYQFIVNGKATSSFMKSPQLMMSISRSIIESCNTVSKVTFGVANTGWGTSIGYFPNGRVAAFKCAEDLGIFPGRNARENLSWGVEFCSL